MTSFQFIMSYERVTVVGVRLGVGWKEKNEKVLIFEEMAILSGI